jgi:hypothetical protein
MLNVCATKGLTSNKDLSKNGLYVYELKELCQWRIVLSVDVTAIFDCLTSDLVSHNMWAHSLEGRVLLPGTLRIHTTSNKSLLGLFCSIPLV